MKKILSILFLFVLISPIIFNYFNIKTQIKSYKKAIKQKLITEIKHDELFKLTISNKNVKDLNWKHSREFEYHNRMFDVVKVINKKDSITYICWIDKEETLLNNKLKSLLTQFLEDNPIEKKQNHKTFNFYNKLYFESSYLTLGNHLTNFLINYKDFYCNYYQFNYLNNIFIPPKFI